MTTLPPVLWIYELLFPRNLLAFTSTYYTNYFLIVMLLPKARCYHWIPIIYVQNLTYIKSVLSFAVDTQTRFHGWQVTPHSSMRIIPCLWQVFSDLPGWDPNGRGSILDYLPKTDVQHHPNLDVWLSFNKKSLFFKVNKLVVDLFGLYSQVYSLHWWSEHEYFWRKKEAEEPESCFEASCMYFLSNF